MRGVGGGEPANEVDDLHRRPPRRTRPDRGGRASINPDTSPTANVSVVAEATSEMPPARAVTRPVSWPVPVMNAVASWTSLASCSSCDAWATRKFGVSLDTSNDVVMTVSARWTGIEGWASVWEASATYQLAPRSRPTCPSRRTRRVGCPPIGARYRGVDPSRTPEVKQAITNSLRTDESNVRGVLDRFVEIRDGTVAQLMSGRHHLVVGRRGVGKTTLLHYVREKAAGDGHQVAVVDLETHKGRQYPDVLIDILEDLIENLRPKFTPLLLGVSGRLRRKSKRILKELREIRSQAPQTDYRVDQSQTRERHGEIGIWGRFKQIGGRFSGASGRRRSVQSSGSYTRDKIESLQEVGPEIQELLQGLVASTESKSCLIFLDDYYFIRQQDQAKVLDFLHVIAKGTGTWLKVGGVGSRLRTYEEGDPPRGMKDGQDVHKLELDLTLENFNTAREFLESVFAGVCEPLGLRVRDVLTDEARKRLVIACGGAVSRDYLSLILDALDVAYERRAKKGESGAFKLSTEDITKAASGRARKKEEEDLSLDAGGEAQSLRVRWRDVRDFAKSRDRDGSPFVLVRTDHMSETTWGREIASLEALRLLHRIGYQTPNAERWRGINCVVFTIDYGFLAVQRLTSAKYWDFWRGQRQMDRLRRATWVYDPDWRENEGRDENGRLSKATRTAETENPDQERLFDT